MRPLRPSSRPPPHSRATQAFEENPRRQSPPATVRANAPRSGTAGRLLRAWPTIKRILIPAFFLLVAYLLYSHLKNVEWAEVAATLSGYSPAMIGLAVLAVAGTFLAYSCYELFGYHFVRPPFPRRRAMLVAFISYGLNLNLGAMVGGIGFRYRMYSRLGLRDAWAIARIAATSIVTNWLGYLLLGGAVFASGVLEVPAHWRIGGPALRLVGVAFLLVAAVYLALCFFSDRRVWTLRGRQFFLPSGRLALAQFAVAACHWACMGAILFVFLQHEAGYFQVFTVLLVSAIAGAATHIPGALGVLEAVFLALLGGHVPIGDIVAALIGYRAAFYLLPLAAALAAYALFEMFLVKGTDPDADAGRSTSG